MKKKKYEVNVVCLKLRLDEFVKKYPKLPGGEYENYSKDYDDAYNSYIRDRNERQKNENKQRLKELSESLKDRIGSVYKETARYLGVVNNYCILENVDYNTSESSDEIVLYFQCISVKADIHSSYFKLSKEERDDKKIFNDYKELEKYFYHYKKVDETELSEFVSLVDNINDLFKKISKL